MSTSDADEISRIEQEQGWNADTMRDLYIGFIYGRPERIRKFLKMVKRVQNHEESQ